MSNTDETKPDMAPADDADTAESAGKIPVGKPQNAAQKLMGKLTGPKETVMLIIECAEPEPMYDAQGVMIPFGDTGKLFMQQPKKDTWKMVMPHDVPDWLKTDQALTRLVAGEELSMYPEKGGRFWRAHVVPASANIKIDVVENHNAPVH